MEVFGQDVFDTVLNYNKLILSGDIDKCIAKKQISMINFNSIVLFSKPEIKLKYSPPELEKYSAYLWSGENEGVVRIKM